MLMSVISSSQTIMTFAPQPPIRTVSQQETWGCQLHCPWRHHGRGAFSLPHQISYHYVEV